MQCSFSQSCLWAICLSILCAPILFAQSKQPPAQRWEYQTTGSCDTNQLAKLGDAGWELVAVTTQGGGYCGSYLLKRPKPADSPKIVDPYERPKPSATAPTCNLTATQAPSVRGVRLGMTVDELIQLFPGADPNSIKAEIEKNKGEPSFGVASVTVYSNQHRERENNIMFSLILLDGQVVSMKIRYTSNSTYYGNILTLKQFIEKLAATYNLPSEQNWIRDKNNPDYEAILKCRDIELQAHAIGSELNFNIIDSSYLEKQQQRKIEALAKKRNEFKP